MNPSTHHEDLRFLELLRRWLEGNFNRADEQELQELTRTDAFRREAMDGFMELPEVDYGIQLASLRNKLKERTGNKKRALYLPQILAVAASITLIIAAIIFYPRTQKIGNEEIAKIEAQDSGQSMPVTPNKEISAEGEEAKRFEKTNSVDRSSGPAASAHAADMKQDRKAGETLSPDKDLAVAEDAALPKEKSAQPTQSSGKTELPQIQADDKLNRATTSQQNPYSPKNSYPNAAPSRPGDFAKAKKSSMANDTSQTGIQTQPQGGWGAFQEYIRQNARLTDQARNNNISGTVRLEFEVGYDGKPINVKVLRGLGYGCNEEAIRLVETWKWTQGVSPVTVDIPFVR